METSQVIAEMLKENTGAHFLDSGGAYGRNWERNQGREFEQEPESVVEFSEAGDRTEICVTHNVYHWLNERLDYDPEMQAKFNVFVNLPENEDKHWLQLMEEFAEKVGGTGIYGEGGPVTINTYNNEDLLSQTIQYTYFNTEDGEFVLLQIHGGCDVRGGYTAPKAFQISHNYGELAIFDNARATIQCEQSGEHRWDTDDGYHWYENGTCGTGYKQLETYPSEELEEPPVPAILNPDLFEKNETAGEYEYKGTVVVCEEKGYCPICGGELKAYP